MIRVRTYGNLYMTVVVNDIIFPVYYPGRYVDDDDTVKIAMGYATTFKGRTMADISRAYVGFFNGFKYSDLVISPRNSTVKIVAKNEADNKRLDEAGLFGHVEISEMERFIAQSISEWIDANFVKQY